MARPTKYQQALSIVQFAKEHELLINPAYGYGYALDKLQKFYHCPCDAARESCPCDKSLEEVKTKGHCKCHLFWRDYDVFLAENFK